VLTNAASLKYTVLLFTLAMLLVFFGTLAQVDEGISTVLTRYFRCKFIAWIPCQIFVRFAQVFFGVSHEAELPGSFPFPGGWLLGELLLINLLAAHAVRFKFTWKRSGIMILHAGLIVMMLSEIIAGSLQVEGRLSIENGKSKNYVEDFHATELAIITSEDSRTDDVVIIPGSMLRSGRVIQADLLPFDVTVERHMANSAAPQLPRQGMPNPATAGDGLAMVAVERPPTSGTSTDQKADLASAYVTFNNKKTGQSLGTYLVSQWLAEKGRPQQVVSDGRTYNVSLRFKRSYKPYTLHLLEFRHDVYPGTDIPKNYSSKVRLVDPSRNEDREVLISMNHPLWYGGYNPFSPGGETFYQSGILGADEGTILQVVRNPGWLLPYVACAMVAVGLLLHFGIKLTGFLRRVRMSEVGRTRSWRWLPLVFLPGGAFALIALTALFAGDRDGQMQLHEFSKIPIQHGGRIKPIDTLARSSLMILSGGHQSFRDDSGQEQSAVKWLLDVMTSRLAETSVALKHKVFRIENDQVLTLLGLVPRAGYRYALEEFGDKVDTGLIAREAARAERLEPSQRGKFDEKIIELARHVELYDELAQIQAGQVVPPTMSGGTWLPFFEAIHAGQAGGQDNPAVRLFGQVLLAYSRGDTNGFNENVAAYRQRLRSQVPTDAQLSSFEVFFNDFDPFLISMVLYVIVFLLTCLGLLGFRRPLNGVAFWLAVLTLLVHSTGLLSRMWIQGRPAPVTNLYSSAIFVGWGCLVLALVLEFLFHNGIGNIVAAVLGFLTMFLARYVFASGSDTMEMMQAVLDTNFWLATHVTCVTFGYAATLVAGALGIVFLLLRLAMHWLNPNVFKIVATMIYGILCFATFLSFTGTVLGGLWADQSWGRFWGWDPKENGALLVVLMNALILHARWGGLVKQKGMAMLAVAGNMIIGWSWIGTNQLGVGLHAYGFNNTLAMVLDGIWFVHAAILCLGFLPTRWLLPSTYPRAELGGSGSAC
jgi:ABC-type transport system involved in cytochrome c biogenesis permease subunit